MAESAHNAAPEESAIVTVLGTWLRGSYKGDLGMMSAYHSYYRKNTHVCIDVERLLWRGWFILEACVRQSYLGRAPVLWDGTSHCLHVLPPL